MNIFRTQAISIFLAFMALSMVPTAYAAEREWDQTSVLQISDKLVSAARRLHIECRTSPPDYLASEGSYNHIDFKYHVRHFLSVAYDLSEAIENGDGERETRPIYKELTNILVDLHRYAGGKRSQAWPLVDNAVAKVSSILDDLNTYYSIG
tara:strand:- start:58002 stop:58454 length:453 start_codon:yes stop_codon:yes gene_type:complete